jgi:hypothetical protein
MPNGTPYGERMIACALRLRRKPPSGFASPPNSCKDALAFVTETALCPAGTLSPKGTRARDANGFATLPISCKDALAFVTGTAPTGFTSHLRRETLPQCWFTKTASGLTKTGAGLTAQTFRKIQNCLTAFGAPVPFRVNWVN